MLIPCCVSVRIQMVLVAPVRISSSTNQIHVTQTEQKEKRGKRVEKRKPGRVRGVKIQQAAISQTFFVLFFNIVHYVTIKSVEHSPPTHTHKHFVC